MDTIITAVAIKNGDMVVAMSRPYRHHDIIAALVRIGVPPPIGPGQGYVQGFLANGEFIDRSDAAILVGRTGFLYSEDLW